MKLSIVSIRTVYIYDRTLNTGI